MLFFFLFLTAKHFSYIVVNCPHKDGTPLLFISCIFEMLSFYILFLFKLNFIILKYKRKVNLQTLFNIYRIVFLIIAHL